MVFLEARASLVVTVCLPVPVPPPQERVLVRELQQLVQLDLALLCVHTWALYYLVPFFQIGHADQICEMTSNWWLRVLLVVCARRVTSINTPGWARYFHFKTRSKQKLFVVACQVLQSTCRGGLVAALYSESHRGTFRSTGSVWTG